MARKNPWFRLYTEMVKDRKIRRLDVAHRWLWIAVLTAASESPHPGLLLLTDGHPLDAHDLADIASLPLKDVRCGLQMLEQRGMVVIESGVWSVPKWGERQYRSDTSTERVKAFRERQERADGTAHETAVKRSNPVTGNAPEAETEAETDVTPPTPPPELGAVDNRSLSHGHYPFDERSAVDASVAQLHRSLASHDLAANGAHLNGNGAVMAGTNSTNKENP